MKPTPSDGRDAERLVDVRLRLLRATHGDFRQPDPGVRRAEIAVERERLLQFADAAGGAIGEDLSMKPSHRWAQ